MTPNTYGMSCETWAFARMDWMPPRFFLLNQQFAGISNDPLAVPIDGFHAELEGEVEMFPSFSLSQVTLQEVSKAIAHFFTEARGVDDEPKSVSLLLFR